MDVEVVVAMERDEIMLVALMVAHEDVLAMHGAVIAPPALSLLYGLALGVIINSKRNVVAAQIRQHGFFSGHYVMVFRSKILVRFAKLQGKSTIKS